MNLQNLSQHLPARTLVLFFLFILTFNSSHAQCTGTTCGPNLIPNPGFELTTSYCGTPGGGILYTDKSPVQDWYGVSCSTCYSNGTTPDNKNSNCNGDPTNNCGDGSGSVGIFIMDRRESIQAKLKAPLIAGHQYCFSMKVRSTLNTFTCDGIGAWFHNKGKIDIDAMNDNNRFLGEGTKLNGKPQVQNPSNNMIGNTCQTVTGIFCATGGEQWVAISNFRTNANTHMYGALAYFTIDEVYLQEVNCLKITAITSVADSVCPGTCTTLTANATGASGNYTYLWSPGGEKTQTITVCPTQAATTYKCTVSSAGACSIPVTATDSVKVYFKKALATPVITSTTPTTFCSGDSVVLTASAAPNYIWSPGGQTSPSITVHTSGLYTVVVKHPVSGCYTASAATNVVVKFTPPPPLLKAGPPEICFGNSAILYVNTPDPSYTYTWINPAGAILPSNDTLFINKAQLKDDGIYHVTASKGECKSSAAGITLTVHALPDTAIVKATSAVICEGLKTQLYVDPANPLFTYIWQTPSGTTVVNDSVILGNSKLSDAGTYTVTVTDAHCTSNKARTLLVVHPAAIKQTVALTKSVICEGDSTLVDAANPLNGISYHIYTQATGGTSIGVAPLKVKPVVTTAYYMEAVTTNGCSQLTNRDTATVIVNAAPVVPSPVASNLIICEGKSTTIQVSNPVSGITYNVYDALTGGTLLGNTPYTVTLTKTTTFYMEAKSIAGCIQTSARTPLTITVNPTPPAPVISVKNATNNAICSGETAQLLSNITTGIYWSTGETTSSIIVTKAGTYTVYFRDVHECQSSKDSVDIKILPLPSIHTSGYIVDTVRCDAPIGGIHGITVSNGLPQYMYQWTEVKNPSTIIGTDLNLQQVPSGTYSLMVTDKNGCISKLPGIFIPSTDGLVVHLMGTPANGFLPLDVSLLTTTSGVGKPVSYEWSLDGKILGITDGKTNTYNLNDLPFGEHVALVVLMDTNGCRTEDYFRITVFTKVKFPDVTIFTPNNDGKNDLLIFPTEGIRSLHGKIYDRWGLKMFEWNDLNTGWDGTKDGAPVPEATYYYIIDYTDFYDMEGSKKGYIQLTR